MVGIYKITSPSNKVYIGKSKDIQSRWNKYYKYLNCKGQPKLYYSLKKYGFKTHKFEIIEECLEEELDIKEPFYKQQFIEKFGWKLALFCEIFDGQGPMSDITKQKISDSKKGCKVWSKGKKFSKKHRNKIKKAKKDCNVWWTRGKKVLQKNLNGELVKEWGYVSEASKFYNIKPNLIHKCCTTNKNKTKKSKSIGFIWEFKN